MSKLSLMFKNYIMSFAKYCIKIECTLVISIQYRSNYRLIQQWDNYFRNYLYSLLKNETPYDDIITEFEIEKKCKQFKIIKHINERMEFCQYIRIIKMQNYIFGGQSFPGMLVQRRGECKTSTPLHTVHSHTTRGLWER